MKKSLAYGALIVAISLLISSCTKPPIIPGTHGTSGGSTSTATITFNNNDVHTVDSIHWDYSGSPYRIQAFSGNTAPFTLYLPGITSGSQSIPSGYLFWIYQNRTYSVTSGSVYIANNNNVLSGTITGTGYSSPYTSPISVTFSNVKQVGM